MGRYIIVRADKQNSQAKQALLDAHVARVARRQEKDDEKVDAWIPTSSGAEPLATTQPRKQRKRKAHASNGATSSRRTRSNKQGSRIQKYSKRISLVCIMV